MVSFNELFVCSQCGHSIAPQLDKLDIIRKRLRIILEEFDNLKQEIETLGKETNTPIPKEVKKK